jgi:hypothetical protein
MLGENAPKSAVSTILYIKKLKTTIRNFNQNSSIVCIPSCAIYEYFIAHRTNNSLSTDILSIFSKCRLIQSNNIFPLTIVDIKRIILESQKKRYKELNNKWLKKKIFFESRILEQIAMSIAVIFVFSLLNDNYDDFQISSMALNIERMNTTNLVDVSKTALEKFYILEKNSISSAMERSIFENVFSVALHFFDQIFDKKGIVLPEIDSIPKGLTLAGFCGEIIKKACGVNDFSASFKDGITPSLIKKGWSNIGVEYLEHLENCYLFKRRRFRKNDILDLAWILETPSLDKNDSIVFLTRDKKLLSYLALKKLNICI